MLEVALTASPNQPKQQLKRSKAQAIKRLRLKPDDRLFISYHCTVIVTVVNSAAVVYVLAQPTDLPRYKENDPRSKEDDR